MALGVLNNLSAIYAENNLNNTNASLQTVLQQLSSGSRINSGADDAAGLSLVNGLAANSAALTQSETNATEGVGLLQVADGALSQVTSLLNRAITLATEASNGTLEQLAGGRRPTRSTSRFSPRSTTSDRRPPTTRIRSSTVRSRACRSTPGTRLRPALDRQLVLCEADFDQRGRCGRLGTAEQRGPVYRSVDRCGRPGAEQRPRRQSDAIDRQPGHLRSTNPDGTTSTDDHELRQHGEWPDRGDQRGRIPGVTASFTTAAAVGDASSGRRRYRHPAHQHQ